MESVTGVARLFAPGNGEMNPQAAPHEALTALRRFARPRPNVERCELCGAELAPEHQHLLNQRSREITCSCDACAILFCGQEGDKFLRVPRRALRLKDFVFTEAAWDALMLPINLAFFLREVSGRVRVMYPSPAGAMESLIEVPSWEELFATETTPMTVEPEVEALIVNRIGGEDSCFVVPIDACYRLVGLIRTKWRGHSGGGEVWQAIADFFDGLATQARDPVESRHA